MGGDVDAREGLARALQHGGREASRRAREREHGAVVVGVGVHVEDARATRLEGRRDGVERRPVAAFRHVGDREQH